MDFIEKWLVDMAKQVEFTKYEAAVLLDAYLKVLSGKLSRANSVKACSQLLREMAVSSGQEIDEVYRNTNGISFQMASMESAYKGKTIMKPATKLFSEIVSLYRTDNEQYKQLLNEAIKMAHPNENNEAMFISWITEKVSSIELKELQSALRDIEKHTKAALLTRNSLYDNLDPATINKIKASIEKSKLFKITHIRKWNYILSSIDYLLQFANRKTVKQDFSDSDDQKAKKDVIGVTETKKKNKEKIQPTSNVTIPIIDVIEVAKQNEMEKKLCEVVDLLLTRHANHPAANLKELKKQNPDIDFASVDIWAKEVYGRTTREYFCHKGILSPLTEKTPEEKKKERLTNLNTITNQLLERYSKQPAPSLTEIIRRNPDIAVTSINALAKEFYSLTSSEYLRNKGILLPLAEKTPEEKRNEKINKLDEVTSILLERYSKQPAPSLTEIIKRNPDIAVTSVSIWTRELYNKSASEYFSEKGILEKEHIHLIKAPNSTSSDRNEQVAETKKEIDTEDDINTQPVDAIELSLFRALEYLKTRYNVRQHYDHIINSDRFMLYKVRNRQKDIMCIDYYHTKLSHHISIETEPEYLEDLAGNFDGFTQITKKASHPCLKLVFVDYGAIRKTLIAICDSIDKYFAAFLPSQAQADRMKFYQKLYSISKVYDDPSGITITKIMTLLKNEASEELVTDILDNASWAKKISSDTYSFSKKAATVLREPGSSYMRNKQDVITASNFYGYLLNKQGMAEATCRSYVLAIRSAEDYAKSIHFYPYKIFDCSSFDAKKVISSLLNDASFRNYNARQHNRFTAAFAKFSDFAGHSNQASTITKQQVVVPNDYSKEKFEQTLLQRYRNGMLFDSIDLDNFRESYKLLFDEELTFGDPALEKRLRGCGVIYKGRLFPAEGIIDNNTKEKLFTYIDRCFATGKKVLYYKAIYEELADDFASCFALVDEDMLRAYIEYTAEKGKYYFFSDYLSIEQQVKIDNSAEIGEYLLNAGKPVTSDEIRSALKHIPNDQITRIIITDKRFLRNAKGEYFHKDIFEVSEEELNIIATIITGYIEENEYAIWTSVWSVIQEKMPVFIENNLYLSSLGIRNALEQRFAGKFNFSSAVISSPENHFTMGDIYQLYAKHHITFSGDDIYKLSKELDTVIYFDALFKVAVRVSQDLYVSKNNIAFDVEGIDRAIGSFMSEDYIRIREIDSYLSFPNIGYIWNEYLLESFVLSYSKKYNLLNNGFSFNNVAGAIAKKDSSIKEFVDACGEVLAAAPIALNKTDALNYLADVNMITRKSYRELDTALAKARQIRARKG